MSSSKNAKETLFFAGSAGRDLHFLVNVCGVWGGVSWGSPFLNIQTFSATGSGSPDFVAHIVGAFGAGFL